MLVRNDIKITTYSKTVAHKQQNYTKNFLLFVVIHTETFNVIQVFIFYIIIPVNKIKNSRSK